MMNELKFYKGVESRLPDISNREEDSIYITKDSGKIIFNSHIWDSKTNTNDNITSAVTETHYKVLNNNSVILEVPIIKYEISYNLINCELTNNIKEIEFGKTYSADINIRKDGDYEITKTLILIGGIDKTKEYLDKKNNKINITKVTGNVSIIILCESNHEYLKASNFTVKSYKGNKPTVIDSDNGFIEINITDDSQEFIVDSNSFESTKKKCRIEMVEPFIVKLSNGREIDLPNYVGFYNPDPSTNEVGHYQIVNAFEPSTTESGYDGKVKFASGPSYKGHSSLILFGTKNIIIRMKLKLIYY